MQDKLSSHHIRKSPMGIGILLMLLLLPLSQASADIGPKPTMSFEFEFQDIPPLQIVSGIQWECSQSTCIDAEPLESLGPQAFSCDAETCSSMAYGYAPYHRLEITFSDGKTRISQVFESDEYNMQYRVIVRSDDLVVEKVRGTGNPMLWLFLGIGVGGLLGIGLFITNLVLLVILIQRAGQNRATWQESRGVFIGLWATSLPFLIFGSFFSLAIPFTVVIETALGLAYAFLRPRPRLRTLTLVLMANMITLPLLWVTIQAIAGQAHWALMLLAEIFVWLAEAALYWATQRKTISFAEALLLSFGLNLASYGLGLLLPV